MINMAMERERKSQRKYHNSPTWYTSNSWRGYKQNDKRKRKQVIPNNAFGICQRKMKTTKQKKTADFQREREREQKKRNSVLLS